MAIPTNGKQVGFVPTSAMIALSIDYVVGDGIAALATSELTEVRFGSKADICNAQAMFAKGHKQTYAMQNGISALPPKADIKSAISVQRSLPTAYRRHLISTVPIYIHALPD